MEKNNFWKLVKENKIILVLFLLSTLYFIYQQYMAFSWDFSVYVLNAKHFFISGWYFEPMRPPLMPLILGVLSIFGWKASEYIFVILVSAAFAYSSVRLAKVLKFNPIAFYALSLSVYLFTKGLVNGTELLSIVFLELFIVYILENRSSSGLFLGLAALSRYTMVAFFPIAFFHFNIKKIIKSFVLFALVLSPWFIYNYLRFGNFFTSFADQYANNILFRGYIHQSVNIIDFIYAQNFLIPFFIVGLLAVLYKLWKYSLANRSKLKRIISYCKAEIMMLFILVYSVYSYCNVPIKDARYLFTLVLPTAYFAYIGIQRLIKMTRLNRRKAQSIVLIALVIFGLNFAGIMLIEIFDAKRHERPFVYQEAISKMDELGIGNCSLMSNAWVMLEYLGKPALPYPRVEQISSRLDEGEFFIFFFKIKEPPFIEDEEYLSSLPILIRNEDYVLIGDTDKCLAPKSQDYTFLSHFGNMISEVHGYETNQNPCFILFKDRPFLEKTCNFINFNGFKLDENRAWS
jgi:hypothetical protein